jgi:serine protease Do
MAPLEAAPSVVLLEFRRSYGLGFVTPSGRIVTSFHVVADEREIVAHLFDGRAIPVKTIAAIDTRRDLAVLDVGVLNVPPARAPTERLAAEGSRVFAFGMVPQEGRTRWVNARISALQVLGSKLTVYRLEGEIPPDASGGPLISAEGWTLGVVTVADSGEGLVTLAVPWRYVAPLTVQNAAQPLPALSPAEHRGPRRKVPNHPLSLLDGSTVTGLEATSEALLGAIRLGAPAYNEGDVERCYQVYVSAAQQLIDRRRDCPGVQAALRVGLARASSLPQVDHRAWALRDAFDGLLMVIEKVMRAQTQRKTRQPNFLN